MERPNKLWSDAMALKPPQKGSGDGIVMVFAAATLLIGAAVGAWADSQCDLTLAERFGIHAEEQPVGTLCGNVITFPGGETVEVE